VPRRRTRSLQCTALTVDEWLWVVPTIRRESSFDCFDFFCGHGMPSIILAFSAKLTKLHSRRHRVTQWLCVDKVTIRTSQTTCSSPTVGWLLCISCWPNAWRSLTCFLTSNTFDTNLYTPTSDESIDSTLLIVLRPRTLVSQVARSPEARTNSKYLRNPICY